MGIQAYVEVEALRRAGCIVEFTRHPMPQEFDQWDNPLPTEYVVNAAVHHPDGSVRHWHAFLDQSNLWIDANHWGDNRTTHLEPLRKLGLTWREH